MAYFDLGRHSRKTSTGSPEAQAWFDRGLVWLYGYNHEEAIVCFERALEADEGLALAHWGIAYAIGPNYNKQWVAFEPDERPVALDRARRAVAAAQALAPGATPAERALIGAIGRRYPEDGVPEEFEPFNDAFAAAMREVYRAHGDDADIAALFAEALMNRTPWQLWDLRSGQPAEGADTAEAIEVLERAFDRLPGAWDHPGLLHMYIHLMEMSPTPERALRHGDRLTNLVPDAGHLIHMASHIDVLCGHYHAVVARNERAIAVDRSWLDYAGPENFYSVYRCHNYHFVIYGAMFLGQPGPAIAAAAEMVSTITEPFLRPMADWFEAFVPMKQHVFVRFGMWEAILAQELPEDRELYSVTTALMHYARAIALANTGRTADAEAEYGRLLAARDRVQETRMLFNNTCRDVLAIGEAMAAGELAYHKGDRDGAFAHLAHAVALDDGLPYDEPWGWMQPARHALGALLMDAGRYDEAEAVYRADLGLDGVLARPCQHPDNLWSLHGLDECLARRGETTERALIRQRLGLALGRASVPVRGSCYCRRAAA